MQQLAARPEDQLLAASLQSALGAIQDNTQLVSQIASALSAHGTQSQLPSALTRSVDRWHFPMLNDVERNEAFEKALARIMPIDGHVLDIGSGTGLLAMMAARAGAARVTTCEQNPLLAEVARQIIDHHGMSDIITVVPKLSNDLVVGVDLPRQADLIVSEIVDCGLIGEGVLPTVDHARTHLLAPGGILLPESARIFARIVDSAAVDRLNRVSDASGFDVGLLNTMSTQGHFPVRLSTWPHRFLSRATEVHSFDFRYDSMADGHRRLDIQLTSPGTAHGLVLWFEMTLADDIVLANQPTNQASHWMQAFVPLDQPISLEAGGALAVDLAWQDNRLSLRNAATSPTIKDVTR